MTRRYFGWGSANFVVFVAAMFPVFWILMLSLKDPTTLGDGRLWPAKFSWKNYKGIFQQSVFTDALRNSIFIALIATFIAVILASAAAYAIARLDFPGKTAILTAALAIAMFPPISIVGPLYNMWRNLGLFDTWLGLIIPYMTFTLPPSTAPRRSRPSPRSSPRWPRRASSRRRSWSSSSPGTTSSSRSR